jgi:hypothetical protein
MKDNLIVDEKFLNNLRNVIHHTEILSKNFDCNNDSYGLVLRQSNPLIGKELLYNFDGEYVTWQIDDYNINNYKLALDFINRSRTQVKEKIHNLSKIGRIICFTTCLTTHDGIAIAESNCFVDESDVPPIDTWFHIEEGFVDIVRPTLFCWIPNRFHSVMEKAIKVEVMESYCWLDEIDKRINSKIINLL